MIDLNTLKGYQTTKTGLIELYSERLNSLGLLYHFELYNLVIADSGYPVELALKVAICTNNGTNQYPPNKIKGNQIRYYEHNLEYLAEICGLSRELDLMKQDNDFYAAWSYISSWDVHLRYKHTGKGVKFIAESCIKSLTKGGVLEWIKSKW